MTREEATRVLKMLKTECGERAQWVLPLDWGVAFDMAIEALSAEPSDLISRADAMSKCKNAENELTDEAERKGLRVARFIIGELPSADRPSGEWIRHEDYGGFDYWECSNCKEEFYFEVEPPKGYNYCPSCGARMGVEE